MRGICDFEGSGACCADGNDDSLTYACGRTTNDGSQSGEEGRKETNQAATCLS
jgi:hypothetical protein